MQRIALGLVLVLGLGLALLYTAGSGWLGSQLTAGTPVRIARPVATIEDRVGAQAAAARAADVSSEKQILFGDFHVHTGFSADAFTMSMPLTGGSGSHTVSDACDFARFCSGLDFWSINDHAEASTPRRWQETIEAIRACDAVGGEESATGGDRDADLISFLGWEWSHMGTTPQNHYGHRNVVLRDLEDDAIPARPIASDSPADYFKAPSALMLGLMPVIAGDPAYLRYATFQQEVAGTPRCPAGVPVRDLPTDCREYAATPGALFEKLDDWGHASLVIPHGMTWGMYTPQGSAWAKQLNPRDHDPVRQRLVEVYSGHGNVEEYRSWRSVDLEPDGSRGCPEPRDDYLPGCWRAGEIIRERCLAEGSGADDCEARAIRARQHYADAPSGLGHLAVPGARGEDWGDAAQCRDCFLAAFSHRPASSAQAMLALGHEGESGERLRFRFGFIGASDTHTARPGTGYKETLRTKMSDARMARVDLPGPKPVSEPVAESRVADPTGVSPNDWLERDRAGSYYFTGGLVAVHAARRDRQAIWDSLDARETYATSGPRILLWFDLLNPPEEAGVGKTSEPPSLVPMGGVVEMSEAPLFEVRAVGSLEQKPGCPESSLSALGPERLERLCGGECDHPSDVRRRITRIEVVRIRPQRQTGEPLDLLIEDPWRSFACPPDPAGCSVRFSDPDHLGAARDAVYYVRAIEAPSPAVNGGLLRCESGEGDACARMRPCDPWAPDSEDCLAPIEERAWSSPIFVDWPRRRSG
ncbi:MAG: DUF3604 domain-containing protein [Deltaproteobacteria bacterium]|jgi:hypothetical protein|nr:DUF3604 domain-containing protein [Deltaproteobacteria bacterium]